jgi:hypothetical protein
VNADIVKALLVIRDGLSEIVVAFPRVKIQLFFMMSSEFERPRNLIGFTYKMLKRPPFGNEIPFAANSAQRRLNIFVE